MGLSVGDLVQYKKDPGRLGVIIALHETDRRAKVCEVIIVYDKTYPGAVGEKRYTHVDYWQKIPQKTI